VCVTHDVGETASFDRILVIADGRIVETGTPADLAAQPGSRYRSLLDAEKRLRERLSSDRTWRTVRIENGRIESAEQQPQ
jgi:ATP-binding cassette subfamily B protein